jgi:hypothetical protein
LLPFKLKFLIALTSPHGLILGSLISLVITDWSQFILLMLWIVESSVTIQCFKFFSDHCRIIWYDSMHCIRNHISCFELRALHLLGRCSNPWPIPPAPNYIFIKIAQDSMDTNGNLYQLQTYSGFFVMWDITFMTSDFHLS